MVGQNIHMKQIWPISRFSPIQAAETALLVGRHQLRPSEIRIPELIVIVAFSQVRVLTGVAALRLRQTLGRGNELNMFPRALRTHPITPPREKITKIIRPEYFYVILGGSYGKLT